MANLLQTALAGPFERVEAVTREIVAGGYSAAAVVNQLLDQLLASPTVTNESRALIAQRIGQVGTVDLTLKTCIQHCSRMLYCACYPLRHRWTRR